MRQIGSQIREDIENTEYTLVKMIERDVTDDMDERNIILQNKAGKCEHWTENDDFAGYVIVIDHTGYEFVRSIKKWTKRH